MRSSTTRARFALNVVALLVMTMAVTAQQSWTCSIPPVEPCSKRHGRLSSQNGIALKLWLVGTRRVAAVANDVAALPSEVRRYLELTSENHSYIFGDFVVCPLEPDTPGQMGQVCITSAEKLVVQPLRHDGSPFRIVSTWPAREKRQ
jgi:hypothetical protein